MKSGKGPIAHCVAEGSLPGELAAMRAQEQAEREKERAQQEKERAQQLAAKLIEMGLDPDNL